MVKILDEPLVKKTFLIPQTLDKALKIKAALEEKKQSEILMEVLTIYLYDSIEKINEENDVSNFRRIMSLSDIHKKIKLLRTAEKLAENIKEELINYGLEFADYDGDNEGKDEDKSE